MVFDLSHLDGEALGLCRYDCRGVHHQRRALGLVRRSSPATRLRGLCHHSLPVATASAVIDECKRRLRI
jgi:hypothetical protein